MLKAAVFLIFIIISLMVNLLYALTNDAADSSFRLGGHSADHLI